MSRVERLIILVALAAVSAGRSVRAQEAPGPAVQPFPPGTNPLGPTHKLNPMPTPSLSPQVLELLKLEDQFQRAVAKGGGQAFASWFAQDGVTLNDGKPAVLGQRAIASVATWDAKSYLLQWYVEGAQMGPSGDTGFTWGHYDAHFTGNTGKPGTAAGRYITFWKKVGGDWKIALDASAADAPIATP